jgi:hypothetical protein
MCRQVLHADVQILYIHTKGVGYREDFQQVQDWRQVMLHFTVTLHQRCYHLLQVSLKNLNLLQFCPKLSHQNVTNYPQIVMT